MLFTSLEFLVLFLPLVLVAARITRGRAWLLVLTAASIVFYGFVGQAWFLLPMLFSGSLDYFIALRIGAAETRTARRRLMLLSICTNLTLLSTFKYARFAFESAAPSFIALGFDPGPTPTWLVDMILPAGISFYTFQTMSYVIDVYRGDIEAEREVTTYLAFVSFFPQLVAGPITRYAGLGRQLRAAREHHPAPRCVSGVVLFSIGLCKKTLIADRIANAVDPLIASIGSGGMLAAWLAMVGYSLQLYFDFSGYSDMAVGLGRLFGIELPQNFDSPYKAKNPSDFWQRWHITLSQWIRDYLYIPLGGNRGSRLMVARNLMLAMALGGLWHGANWTFVCWGVYHGLLLMLYRSVGQHWDRAHRYAQRGVMFVLAALGWVMFRATSIGHAGDWFAALFGASGLGIESLPDLSALALVLGGLVVAMVAPNAYEMDTDSMSVRRALWLAPATVVAILLMNYASKFIYYQF